MRAGDTQAPSLYALGQAGLIFLRNMVLRAVPNAARPRFLELAMLVAYVIASLVVGFCLCVLAGTKRPWIVQAGYAATVTACVVTASKLTPAPGGTVVSVAIGLYSMSFLLTDYLGEVFDRATAYRAVAMGIIAELVLIFAVYFSIAVPAASFWENQEAFSTALGAAPRIMVASVLAFVVAQLLDVTMFDWMKRKFEGRLLFVRNNVSTFLGQTADSIVFYTVAFAGIVPNLLELIVATCIVKYAIAALDTPVIYLARGLAHRNRPASAE